MGTIRTVTGDLDAKEIGVALPHEHLFFDLRGPSRPKDLEVDREAIIEVVLPSLLALKARGASTLFECSTGGIGRDPLILKGLADRGGIKVVAPTGMYKDPFMPQWVRDGNADEVTDWMRNEIRRGIEGTSVKAGFIKLAATSEGLTALEAKVLRAAARAASDTGAAIADHTENGAVLLQEVRVLKEERFDLGKFIWVHAHVEPDLAQHVRAAEMGINIEYDAIGGDKPDGFFIGLIREMAAKGHEGRVLLSQDAGGYDAGEPGGGKPRDMCYIFDRFLPAMEAEGMKRLIPEMITDNPRRVFELT